MKKKRELQPIFLTVMFAAFIAAGLLGLALLPKSTVSELERRTLASAPDAGIENIVDGGFSTQAETWFSDHFPLRSSWVGLFSAAQLAGGNNGAGGVLVGGEGRLFAAPAQYDEKRTAQNCALIADFIEQNGLDASYIPVPSSGAMLSDALPPLHPVFRDAGIISLVDAGLSGRAEKVDVAAVFSADADMESLYYRTDHHWTSRGAYLAACAFAKQRGFSLRSEKEYAVASVDDFYGTSYAKAGLWSIAPDRLEMWDSGADISVDVLDDGAAPVSAQSVFFRNNLDTMDKYSVFLGGNHSLVKLTNPTAEGGKLLVIKDSFANCLVPFLAEHYSEIYMIDLRHYRREAASELVKREGITEALFVYGVDSLSGSDDFIWLK